MATVYTRSGKRLMSCSAQPWLRLCTGAARTSPPIGYVAGEPFDLAWREQARSGVVFQVRDYQRQAAEAFYLAGSERGGSGVVVLPCGAGKTVVGIPAMEMVKQTTLVLTTSPTSVKQWHRELLDKTRKTSPSIPGSKSAPLR